MDPTQGRDVAGRAFRSGTVESWLTGESLTESERLERLAGDAELFVALEQQGFAGPDWDFFADVLARYGLAVIRGWMRRGLIEAKCAEKRIRVRALTADVLGDDSAITAIADETVAEALQRFRDEVLIRGAWDPARGASLKTFFVGQCLLRYGNVLAGWYRHEMPTADADPGRLVTAADRQSPLRPVEDDVIRSMTAEALLRGASSERGARVLALDACGYTNAEVAADVGATESAVANLLNRERARLRRAHPHQTGRGTA